MVDLKKTLNPNDMDVLSASGETSWIPKEPSKILLPYKTETTSDDALNVNKRRQKAKEVVDGYNVLGEECRRLEAEIEEKCKDVKITLNKSEHLNVIAALRRVFPNQPSKTEITFEEYKICIQELAKINNQLPEI